MKLIDIDQLETVESHIHYIKIYQGSSILMDSRGKLHRYGIKFSVEHKPVGPPDVKVSFLEHPHFPIINIIKKMKLKIMDMNKNGNLSSIK